MAKLLSDAQVETYLKEGYLAPVRVMGEGEARDVRAALETMEAGMGGPLKGDVRHKPHLLFPFLADLVRHPVILDAIEDVLGPDILCWSSNFFIKEAETASFVSWHQDSTYWGLSTPDVATAWVALTPSNLENGAMAVIPGSHTMDQIPHHDTFAQDNLLTRGQEIMVEVDESEAVPLVLRPGEMSLHHVRLVHGSPPNPSAATAASVSRSAMSRPRCVSSRARTAPLWSAAPTAITISSTSRARGKISTPSPRIAQAHHPAQREILYRGTGVGGYNDPRALRQ